MAGGQGGARSLGRRLLWFVALWCSGVLAVAIVAYLLRLVVHAGS